MTPMNQIKSLVDRGALFVLNHSGGKDSQAMMIHVLTVVPASQIIVVHADLGEVEWPGTEDHARKYVPEGIPFIKVKAVKSFWDMVESRQNWPSPSYRQCTSDLKRGPIEKAIRHHLKATGHTGLVVNCMGLRAQESCSRAKQQVFKLNARNSKAGREWYDWLPIHDWTKDQVILAIKKAGQQLHFAYGLGMSRLSCAFCIMSNGADLKTAATNLPELYARYVETEKRIGKTVFMKKGQPVGLEDITGIKAGKKVA